METEGFDFVLQLKEMVRQDTELERGDDLFSNSPLTTPETTPSSSPSLCTAPLPSEEVKKSVNFRGLMANEEFIYLFIIKRYSANLPFGYCVVTELGEFDARKGGHLVLWDCKMVIEFPTS